MQEQAQSRTTPKPAAPVQMQSLTLMANNGVRWDTVAIAANKDLPKIIIWGTGTAQRCFLKDSGKSYKEVSWIIAKMPDYNPM